MRVSRVVCLAIVPSVMMLAACGGGAKKLPEAVFDIPVYEPSTLDGQMGSTSGGDGFVVKGMGWFFKTSDKPDKIIAWYKKKLPQAEKIENDEGDTVFSYKPKGAEEHELVEIFVKKESGEFTIHEDVLPSKRK